MVTEAARLYQARTSAWLADGNMKKMLFTSLVLAVPLFVSCEDKNKGKAPAVDMARDAGISHYIRRENAETAIVFVHGIFGGAVGTWTNTSSKNYWPEMLKNDGTFKGSDIYVYSYASPLLGPGLTIDELIENMRLVLNEAEIFQKHKRVIFVCHSMGGIITRGFLKRYSIYAPQVPLIYFFATPTSGSHVTELAKFLSENPQLHGMLPAGADTYVTNLQRDWRAMQFHVNSKCAYETLDTYGIRIVDQMSADALCDGPVDPMATNHIDIVKPKDSSDFPYIAFKQAYQAIPGAASTTAPPIPTVTGMLQTARSIDVACGQTRDDVAEIPPPVEMKPEQKVVEALASLQEASNLKDQLVESKGFDKQSAKVHYKLTGLDAPAGATCPGRGYGVILITFIVSQPATLVAETEGWTPVADNSALVSLAAKSGTLRIANLGAVTSIDSPNVAAHTYVLHRNDIRIRDLAPVGPAMIPSRPAFPRPRVGKEVVPKKPV